MSLKEKFKNTISKELMRKLGIKNPMRVPHLKKIVINVGLGEALKDKKVIGEVSKQLAIISGQKPIATRAKRSISTFKLRAGMSIGLKVTLRGQRMYDFFEKLVTIVLMRTRDFRGLTLEGFDGRGNYSLGFSEQIVFPEIDYGNIDKIRGLQVTIVTTAKDKKEAEALLTLLGMPFQKAVKDQNTKGIKPKE